MSEALRQELASQSISPPANDPRIASFSQSLLNLIETPKVHELESVIDSRGLMPSYAANLALRCFQSQLLRGNSEYPRAFTKESVWGDAINSLLDDDQSYQQIMMNAENRRVQSNVVERYKAFKLVASLMHERFNEEVHLLDVGCSRNHGLKKLKLNLPFKPLVSGQRSSPIWPSDVMDKSFNFGLKQPMHLAHCIGSDINPISNDDDNAFWAKSCSFYPSELLVDSEVSEYDYLDTNDVEGVEFVPGDFTDKGLVRPYPQGFEIIIASTFMYQLNETEREKARELFSSYLSDNGIIIYQDFVRPSSDDRGLDFEDNWFSSLYPYRTLVEIGDNPKVYEAFRFNNGRCAQWAPGKDLDSLAAA